MLSNRAFVAVLLVVSSQVAIAAPETVCPQKHQDGSKIGRLNSADVFDGPPENLASLIPDTETWEWDLSQNQKYAKDHGESFYLVCRYKGIKSVVVKKIPYSAKFCKVAGIKNGTYAACR